MILQDKQYSKNFQKQKRGIDMARKCCGTCAFNKPEYHNVFVCDNEESDYYGLETEYNESCIDYSEDGE